MFYDYGGVYCCVVCVYVLFCNRTDVCCVFSVVNVVCFLSLRVGLCIVSLCSGCDGLCVFS